MKHIDNNEPMLIVDNNKQKPIETFMHNIGKRINFNPRLSVGKVSSFDCAEGNGRSVKSSIAPFSRSYIYSNCYYMNNDATYHLLQNLFDQTLDDSYNKAFLANGKHATITLELGGTYVLNRLRIFPSCEFPTRFKVSYVTENDETHRVTGHVEPAKSCVIGSFTDIEFGHIAATKVLVELEGLKVFCYSNTYLAAMSEIELYYDGNTPEERFTNFELIGTSTWVLPGGTHTFSETVVQGGASFGFMTDDKEVTF